MLNCGVEFCFFHISISSEELHDSSTCDGQIALPHHNPPNSLHIGKKFKAVTILHFDLQVDEHAFFEEFGALFDDFPCLLIEHRNEFLKPTRALS